ncbi:TauD/TfdA family dioxygenase [Streptomyces cacaoi]|uniref:TauD/TfdA family dioxygenase n=1 Tax=Streptomyces cacaoi TaxID=1898 RepID=UPI0011F0EA85|nr:TauD/TfdA family dioxygenase [Streptomyces cacaoi]
MNHRSLSPAAPPARQPADGPAHGTFATGPADAHVALRERLLGNGTPLTELTGRPAPGPAAGPSEALHAEVSEQLWSRGLAAIQLDEPLSDDRFTALGDFLGSAMPERDPAVAPYVQREVILNLRSEHGRTDDVSLQPFAANYLSLHTESSGAPLDRQPRYIVLMCLAPGAAAQGARTVLVPMREVAGQLSPRALEVLSRTRYRDRPGVPTIARRDGERWVFSFRDFLADELHWSHEGPDAGGPPVGDALRELLAAMYTPAHMRWVQWRRGLLVVIDNTYFFHGRTSSSATPEARLRHLKRLRVV